MRIVHVLRKPLAGPVAANVLDHGTGAINVDACRIPTATPRAAFEQVHKPNRGSVYHGRLDGSLAGGSRVIGETTEGRWPPNVIFEHLPECRVVGTRRVKGAFFVGGGSRPGGFGNVGTPEKGDPVPVGRSYADPDGRETVADWECAPGCPVADLDGQSSEMGMHSAGSALPSMFREGLQDDPDRFLSGIGGQARVGDDGGASRFFVQVGGRGPIRSSG
jgi:site-specific DNA-methyltransferase (adenine-specific)